MMQPPHAPYRQDLAHGLACDILPFVSRAGGGTYGITSGAALAVVQDDIACETFPSNWPSRAAVGPFFCTNFGKENSSHRPVFVVESETITTNDRGRLCGNYWRLAFWSCRCRPVWTTIFSAGFWGQALARPLRRSRAATCMRAQFWAAFLAPSATMSASAARDTDLTAAFGPYLNHRPNGQAARLAFFAFLPCAAVRAGAQQEPAHV